MARKMSKDIKKMVENANNLLRNRYLTQDDLLMVATLAERTLNDLNMYHGYNHYTEKTINGEDELVLDKDGKIVQFYIV